MNAFSKLCCGLLFAVCAHCDGAGLLREIVVNSNPLDKWSVATAENRIALRCWDKILIYDLESGQENSVPLPTEAHDKAWKGSLALWGPYVIYGDRSDDKICVVDITSKNVVFSLDGPAGFKFGTYLLVQNDVLFVCSQPYTSRPYDGDVYQNPGIVEAYDLKSGERMWRLDSPRPEIGEWGAVVVPQDDGYVVVGNHLGRWKKQVGYNEMGYMEWESVTYFALVESRTGVVENLVSVPVGWPDSKDFVSAVAANSRHIYLGTAWTSYSVFGPGSHPVIVVGPDGGVVQMDLGGAVTGWRDSNFTDVFGVGMTLAADEKYLYAGSNGYAGTIIDHVTPKTQHVRGDVIMFDAETLEEVDRLANPHADVFLSFGDGVWLCDDYAIVCGEAWSGDLAFYVYERPRVRNSASDWELFE